MTSGQISEVGLLLYITSCINDIRKLQCNRSWENFTHKKSCYSRKKKLREHNSRSNSVNGIPFATRSSLALWKNREQKNQKREKWIKLCNFPEANPDDWWNQQFSSRLGRVSHPNQRFKLNWSSWVHAPLYSMPKLYFVPSCCGYDYLLRRPMCNQYIFPFLNLYDKNSKCKNRKLTSLTCIVLTSESILWWKASEGY